MGSFDVSCAISGAPVRVGDRAYWGFFRSWDVGCGSLIVTPLFGGIYDDYGVFAPLEGTLDPDMLGVGPEMGALSSEGIRSVHAKTQMVVFLKDIFDALVDPFPECLDESLVSSVNEAIHNAIHQGGPLVPPAYEHLMPPEYQETILKSRVSSAVGSLLTHEHLRSAFEADARNETFLHPCLRDRRSYTLLSLQDLWRRWMFEDLRRYVSPHRPRYTQQDKEEFAEIYRKQTAALRSLGYDV